MANKPGTADFFPEVPAYPEMGTFQPVYGKFDLTTYIQGASDYEIMAFLVGKYNACLEAYDKVTKLSTDTITAAHQLQDWINSWFDNLDVQQELNNKIDSMVADGSFGTLLHQTFDAQINQQTTSAVTTWLVANVTPTGSAVVVDKSLSIEGAAADAKTVGQHIQAMAIGSSRGFDATYTPGETAMTYSWNAGSYVFGNNRFQARSNMTSTTVQIPNDNKGATYAIIVRGHDLTYGTYPNIQYQTNDIVIGVVTLTPENKVDTIVFAPHHVDDTLSIENAPADAKTVGQHIQVMAIGSSKGFDEHYEKNDDYITYSWDSGSYVFGNNRFQARSNMTSTTVQIPKAQMPGTFSIAIRDNKLVYLSYPSPQFQPNDIVINTTLYGSGVVDTAIFTLKQYEQPKITPGNNTFAIFNKVVCCGDSFTSGHIVNNDVASRSNHNFAWPKFISKITGNTFVNAGSSGATVISWQTSSEGMTVAKNAGVSQCYIIGLGLNDSRLALDLGTSSDIGTGSSTYYGGYSKIIEELHSVSPNAIIFCLAMPYDTDTRHPYNEAIKNICSAYLETYHTHFIDLRNYVSYYDQSTVAHESVGGHYTASGYEQLAEILNLALSDYINNNYTYFRNVNLIPYTE